MYNTVEINFEIDINYYKSANSDLAELNDDQLTAHFKMYGINEGRLSSEFSLKENFFNLVNLSKPALEIGPFCNPQLRGENAYYFDVMSADLLCQRAEQLGLATNNCPSAIHYISSYGDLTVIKDKFEAVASSHNIEHQYDLVRHLQSVSNILQPNGRYFLCIPDKRFMFDYYLPETSITDVLDAYDRQLKRHSIASVLEHRAFATHNDPLLHWAGDHGLVPTSSPNHFDLINKALDEYLSSGDGYIDVHTWKFTPYNFVYIVDVLNKLKLITFTCDRIFNTPHGRGEFCVILRYTPLTDTPGLADAEALPAPG
ncbi:hypothetical protein [Desulfovibrio sp. DV]|uniref:hypothetical protein n=1 Tax=Desulfovibrio sp. DV TaxID=1844708 RepID=UPI000A63B626|nr:hypothetical protein [Desulfovibrio sp. DV]